MYRHSPLDYVCPFCLLVQGVENNHVISKQTDIIYQDQDITAFISAEWKINNPGHVLIVTNRHIENIYELPVDLSNKVHAFEIELAKALKSIYKCDGVSSRQHNEPAGNQDVWHYHLHVFPRYVGDNMYTSSFRKADIEERSIYSKKLRDHLKVSK